MTIKTITYTKVFPLAAYVNEKIGVEVEVNEGENPTELFSQAKSLVNSWGTIAHESAGWDNETGVLSLLDIPSTGTMPHVQPVPVRNLAAERLEILIEQSTTYDELEKHKADAEKFGLHEQYNAKSQQLNYG